MKLSGICREGGARELSCSYRMVELGIYTAPAGMLEPQHYRVPVGRQSWKLSGTNREVELENCRIPVEKPDLRNYHPPVGKAELGIYRRSCKTIEHLS